MCLLVLKLLPFSGIKFNYILKLIAWHEMTGNILILIYGNNSTDGSCVFLVIMTDMGILCLIDIPFIEKKVQISAYNHIEKLSIEAIDTALLIDADGFLTHDFMKESVDYQSLSNLLEVVEVRLLAVSRRCFGSPSPEQNKRPNIERFHLCSSYPNQNLIQFLKPISIISHLKTIKSHTAFVAEKKYIELNKDEIRDFILLIENDFRSVTRSERTKITTNALLKVIHYIISSKKEYIDEEVRMVTVSLGGNHKRCTVYFKNHNFKDQTFIFPLEKYEKLKSRMTELLKKFMHILINISFQRIKPSR